MRCFLHLRASVGAVVLAGFLLVAGCDTSVQPFAEDRGLYSVYGLFTLSQDTHFVRVRSLNDPPADDSVRPLDATVTLENRTTGRTEMLEDSVVVFEGEPTHNFRVTQAIQPGASYRLTVERSDGRATRADLTMPPVTQVQVDPDSVLPCATSARLTFENVPAPRFVEVSARLVVDEEIHWVSLGPARPNPGGRLVIGYGASSLVSKVVPQQVLDAIGDPRAYCQLLDDKELRIAYTHYGPDWPADSIRTDPTASTVDNGLGFFGGLRRDTLTQQVVPGV
jgi:hypothetical protein